MLIIHYLIMMKYIVLHSRGDRLRSHLLQYLSIIIYAFYNNLYIIYEPSKINYLKDYHYEGKIYNASFFVHAIITWVDNHNSKFTKINFQVDYDVFKAKEYSLNFETKFLSNEYFYTCDLLIITTQVLYNIKSDLISYFKKYLHSSIRQCLQTAVPTSYCLPFEPSKTILIHLRLDDVKDRRDYDGSVCSNYYKHRIDADNQNIQGIAALGYCNRQTPLEQKKVELAITEAKRKYPGHEIIMIAAPGEDIIDFPYKCIRSNDENYDLFLLCNADVLILSRSIFSLSAAFLGIARETWCPLWGHFVCTGLYAKYDNSKFNYFF